MLRATTLELQIGREPGLELAHHRHEADHLGDRSNSERDASGKSNAPSWEALAGSASQRATSALARSQASDVAGAAMISSACGCISRSSSDMWAWATSQPVCCIATASAALLSLTSACAARIRGAHSRQASMCSSKTIPVLVAVQVLV